MARAAIPGAPPRRLKPRAAPLRAPIAPLSRNRRLRAGSDTTTLALAHRMLNHTLVSIGPLALAGELALAEGAVGLVLFVHGHGSSRASPRNQRVAQVLQQQGLATLLIDLALPGEAPAEAPDVERVAQRLTQAIDALPPAAAALPLGLFAAGSGAAAALIAAVERPQQVRAIVTRGGRTDLADRVLPQVRAPILLIAGGADPETLRINREAYARLQGIKRIEAVPRATHLFLEAGTLEAAALRAGDWFCTHLPSGG